MTTLIPKINFKNGGATPTGASTRSIDSKLQDFLSVKDFGATGDGTTDDTTAIQNALNACSAYGTVIIPVGTYVISATLTIPINDISIVGQGGRPRILAKASTNFNQMISGTSKSRINISNLYIDANKANRSSGQNVVFSGIYNNGGDDFVVSNCYITGTRGYGGTTATAIAFAAGLRNCAINCTMVDCGDVGAISDGIYMSGTGHMAIGCTAQSCLDTGFAMENCNQSGIVGCISLACASAAAIVVSGSSDCYGNFISGITANNWNASVTGGIQIGCLNAASGNLYDTNIDNVTMYANLGASYGTGPAINIRQVGGGSGKTQRIKLANITIRNCTTQGILVLADYCTINSPCISGAGTNSIQFQSNCIGGIVEGGSIICSGQPAIISQGTSTVSIKSVNTYSATYAYIAYDTSVINALNNVNTSVTVGYWTKDAGATVNEIGIVSGQPTISGVSAGVPSGTLNKGITLYDKSGAVVGKIAVYS
jgi:hypothetical protein